MSNVVHGGNIEELARKYNLKKENIIDFSANINPLGLSENVKKAIIKSIDEINIYPDITYYNLKKSISNYEKTTSDYLTLGNGAAEVIFNLVRAVNPKKALLLAPTFGEYEEALLSVNSKIEYYMLSEGNNWDIGIDILDQINEDINIIFICNPNNPTGRLTDRNLILKILKKAKSYKCIVVIDESFLDFVKENEEYTLLKYIEVYNNLFIIKSLTKFFAMPGLRIGYGITSNIDLVKKISNISVPWNINVLAEKSTIKALEEKEYIKNTIAYIENEKSKFYNELCKFKDLKVFKPSVNYIMFKVDKNIDLKEEMMKENIIIRSCSNYNGLNNKYYRIAVRKREENEKFVAILKKILN